MAASSIGDALQKLFKDQRWTARLYEKRLQSNWEAIVGKTISGYTDSLRLSDKTLIVQTSVAVLKHELQMMKPQLIGRINEFYNTEVVKEIVVK